VKVGLRRRSEPDWGSLARELKRPGVSLMVLWEEYRQSEPDGYGYSRFCDLFREFERRLSPVMRQHHVAGDKVFVDYSGKRIAIVDPGTGVVREAEIFVGVLGASSYTYAEASFTHQGQANPRIDIRSLASPAAARAPRAAKRRPRRRMRQSIPAV
jgi:transposase